MTSVDFAEIVPFATVLVLLVGPTFSALDKKTPLRNSLLKGVFINCVLYFIVTPYFAYQKAVAIEMKIKAGSGMAGWAPIDAGIDTVVICAKLLIPYLLASVVFCLIAAYISRNLKLSR